jgi:hypothetical protein
MFRGTSLRKKSFSGSWQTVDVAHESSASPTFSRRRNPSLMRAKTGILLEGSSMLLTAATNLELPVSWLENPPGLLQCPHDQVPPLASLRRRAAAAGSSSSAGSPSCIVIFNRVDMSESSGSSAAGSGQQTADSGQRNSGRTASSTTNMTCATFILHGERAASSTTIMTCVTRPSVPRRSGEENSDHSPA